MKIVCVMATHRRPDITTETLKMLKKQSISIDVVVVGDSKIEREVAEKCGCIYVKRANKPLSKKWQAGISEAKKLDPDAVMVCGSDSWLTPKWCEIVFSYTKKFDLVGINHFYACKAYPNEKVRIIHREYQGRRASFLVGSGRMFSRRILDKSKWIIYPGTSNSALDLKSYNVVKSNKGIIKNVEDKNLKVLSVKSTWGSLNPWNKYIKSKKNKSYPDIQDPKKWLSDHFPYAVDSLNDIVEDIIWEDRD